MNSSFKFIFLAISILLMVSVAAKAQTAFTVESFEDVKPGEGPVSEERLQAKKVLERLLGMKVPIDHPLLLQMEAKIQAGDIRGAVQLGLQHPMYLNTTMKQFGAAMSSRRETRAEDLSDFAAGFVGAARDNMDARKLLTDNFHYRGQDGTSYPYGSGVVTINLNYQTGIDIPGSAGNSHYLSLQRGHVDLSKALVKENSQYLVGAMYTFGPLTPYPNPDPAGVLTSAMFLTNHVGTGHNRRMVQYIFQDLLCAPITEWADNTIPDTHITRDLTRFPAGNSSIYQNTCRSCHGPMDALRPAFGRIEHWEDHHDINHSAVSQAAHYGGTIDQGAGTGIVFKINQMVAFPYGTVLKDSNYVNYLVGGRHDAYFGWRGPLTGSTMKEFGAMVGNSKRFSRCMAQRAFEAVCLGDPKAPESQQMFEEQGEQFEQSGYQFKKLFENVIVDPRCLK